MGKTVGIEQNEIGRHIMKSDGTEEVACIRLENEINSRVAEFLAIQEAIRILEEKHGDMHTVIKTDSRATI
ncbi:hypothetical protein GWI33_012498 [Rhynchophorus ferrugineus]|uniref:Uncharacterized protein n=1 Tax=Rhynchophorus ferrugineus TaxID=354439 RepID=A0A834I5E8_RHYFE|nr:hypothetical protein GWI33_012498 [Rhynchophorus ferrugineus]